MVLRRRCTQILQPLRQSVQGLHTLYERFVRFAFATKRVFVTDDKRKQARVQTILRTNTRYARFPATMVVGRRILWGLGRTAVQRKRQYPCCNALKKKKKIWIYHNFAAKAHSHDGTVDCISRKSEKTEPLRLGN